MTGKKTIINQDEVVILKIKSEKYNQNIAKILQTTMPDYSKCIYLSLNKPYSFLLNFLPKNEIDVSKVMVIDCVSETTFVKGKNTENLIVCGSPPDFTQISIAIEEIAKKTSGNKLLVLDSLSNLLVHSSENNVAKFLGFLISLLRSLNISGILLAVEEQSLDRIEKFVSPSCDWIGSYEDKVE